MRACICESFNGGPPAKYIWFVIRRIRIHRLVLTLSLIVWHWRLKNCRNHSWHVGTPRPSISFPLSSLCHMLSLVWLFATPWTVAHQALLSMDSPGKNTGAGCHFLLQGTFPSRDPWSKRKTWECAVVLFLASQCSELSWLLSTFQGCLTFLFIQVLINT